jgi:3-oxoacyl-[acyl-carrier-protein] synthase II
MKTYLTKYKTLSTTNTKVLSDLIYPQRVHWMPELYARVKTGLSYVPHEMANRVATQDLVDYVKSNPVDGKTAFLLAAGSQGWAGGKAKNQDRPSELDYTFKLGMLTMTNVYAGRMASVFEAYDFVSTDASACASSIKCMVDAKNLIDNLGFDRVIILALEDQTSKMTLEFFGQMKANILISDEEKGAMPSAFDSKNGGFIIGQGAAIGIIESERAVNKNAVKPEAELRGVWVSAEQLSNPIGQRPDGQGYQRAITGAMAQAKCKPEDIKIVKTHGTGTPTNNQSEKNALLSTLRGGFIATSYKQYIGHTVAASGLLETGLILDDIKKGIIPAIKNRTEDDDTFISKDTAAPEGLLMSLAAGMGNIYAAAIFDQKV